MLRYREEVVYEGAKDAEDERRVSESDYVERGPLGKRERTARWVTFEELERGRVKS